MRKWHRLIDQIEFPNFTLKGQLLHVEVNFVVLNICFMFLQLYNIRRIYILQCYYHMIYWVASSIVEN